MRKTLFRPEANQTRASAWFGKVVLLQPLSMRVLSWTIFALSAASALFLCQASYTRRIAVSGTLAPDIGLVKVQSAHQGVVLQRLVKEAQSVRAGEVLYVISSEVIYAPGDDSSARAGMSATMLEKLRAREDLVRTERANAASLIERERSQWQSKVSSAQLELAQLDQELAIQQERLAGKQATYDSNAAAHSQGFISSLALQQRYDDLLDQKARLQAMRRMRVGLARQLADAQAELASLAGKWAQSQAQFERQMLEIGQDRVAQEAGGKSLVTAPQAGTIAAVLAEPGQRVDNQPLVILLPEGAQLEAHLFVPSTVIASIHEGDPVELRLAAFPYQKFGALEGKISQISQATLTAPEQGGEAGAQGSEARYRVRVALPAQALAAAGRFYALRPGMQFEALLTQEKRTLLAWLIEPLQQLKDRV